MRRTRSWAGAAGILAALLLVGVVLIGSAQAAVASPPPATGSGVSLPGAPAQAPAVPRSLVANEGTGQCLDGFGRSPVYTYDCTPENQFQRWEYRPDRLLQNEGTGQCLDGFGRSPVYTYDCTPENQFQRWNLSGPSTTEIGVDFDVPTWAYGRNTDCLRADLKASLAKQAQNEREGRGLTAEQGAVLLSIFYTSGAEGGGKARCLDEPAGSIPGTARLDLGDGAGVRTLPANLLLDSDAATPTLTVSTPSGSRNFLLADGSPLGPGGGIFESGPGPNRPTVGQCLVAACAGILNYLDSGLLSRPGVQFRNTVPNLTNPSGLIGAPRPSSGGTTFTIPPGGGSGGTGGTGGSGFPIKPLEPN